MASPTYDEIRTRVLARDYGSSGDSTIIGGYINEAYEDVCNRHRWPWLATSATVTLTAGVATFDLSTLNPDLLFHGRLRTNQSGGISPVEIVFDHDDADSPWRNYQNTTSRGRPTHVARTGERTLEFSPVPDAAYTYTYYYWREPTLLVNNSDEPLMPPSDREVLVYGALKRLAERERDWTAVGYYEQQFESRIEHMRARANSLTKAGSSKVPMPGHYYGEFD